MIIYNNTHIEILKVLAKFQYLTVSQFVKLNITKTKSGIYNSTPHLTRGRRPLVKKADLVTPKLGRIEALHYLNSYGAKFLVNNEILNNNEINRPQRKEVYIKSDYFHRVWTVDFFISAFLWAKKNSFIIDNINYYFQQSRGSNRNNKDGQSLSDNKIDINIDGVGYIIPDGVGLIYRKEKTPLFFLFEQHNGKDTKRVLQQIHGHVIAIINGLPSIKYQIKYQNEYISNRVFIVFEYESCMKATIKKLANSSDFQPFIKYFLFKTNEQLNNTCFSKEWLYINDEYASF